MQNQEGRLASEPVGRLLWSLAIPAIAAQVVNVLYNMVDRIYIGHIPGEGAAALTGVGVTMPVILLVSAFAALISMGGAPRASIMMGRGRQDEAELILGNCAAALVLMSLMLTALILLFGRGMLLAFGASADTIRYAWPYLSIYALGTIAVQLSLGLNAFITAQGFSRVSMLTVLIGALCNIALDPVFIFVLGMDVQGAALATILSQTISALWVIRFLTGPKTVLRIRKANLRIRPSVCLPCMALGLSPFVMQLTESLLSISFNASLAKYGGDLAVGAMAILHSVMQFSLLPSQGLTQGAQPIVSFNYGAGNRERVRGCFRALLLSSTAYTMLVWLAAMVAPRMFAAMFTADEALCDFTVHALRIYMGTMGLFGIQTACQHTFLSMGNARTSLFLALLRKVFLLIPLIFILPLFLPDKVDAVLMAEPIADFIAVSVTSTMFAIFFRKYLRATGKT